MLRYMRRYTQIAARGPGRPKESLSDADALWLREWVRAVCRRAGIQLANLGERQWIDYVMRKSGRNGNPMPLSIANARELLGRLEKAAPKLPKTLLRTPLVKIPELRAWVRNPGAIIVLPGEGRIVASHLADEVRRLGLRSSTVERIEAKIARVLELYEDFFETPEAAGLQPWLLGPRRDALRYAGLPASQKSHLPRPTLAHFKCWDELDAEDAKQRRRAERRGRRKL
jgi:hypothetical protein